MRRPVKRPSEAADRAAFSGAVLPSDAQWRSIVTIRRPRVPEAVARAALEQALADYRGFASLNPDKLKAERRRCRRIVKLAGELEAELRAQQAALSLRRWRKGRAGIEDVAPEHEAVAEVVLYRVKQRLKVLDTFVAARARRRDPEHAFLLGQLFDVWVDCFGGSLTRFTNPPGGGDPTGPLINFVQAATQGMFSPALNPHTIRAHALQQQEDRERLRRERLRKGILTHKR